MPNCSGPGEDLGLGSMPIDSDVLLLGYRLDRGAHFTKQRAWLRDRGARFVRGMVDQEDWWRAPAD